MSTIINEKSRDSKEEVIFDQSKSWCLIYQSCAFIARLLQYFIKKRKL